MFYISGVDGKNLRYDPTEFRQARDVERLHVKSNPAVLFEEAVQLELSKESQGFPPLTGEPATALSRASETQENYIEGAEADGDESETSVAVEIMSSPVVTLSPSSGLKEAAVVFREYRYRYIPVTDEENALVGILSDRDFLRVTADDAAGSEAKQQIADVMVRNVLNARPQAEISAIANVLFRERIGAMPIVGKDGKLRGLVTRSDIQRAYLGVRVEPPLPIQPGDKR